MSSEMSEEYRRSIMAVLHALNSLPSNSEIHNLWGLLSADEVCAQLREDLDSPNLCELTVKLENICNELGPGNFFLLEGGLRPLIIPMLSCNVDDAPQCQPLTEDEFGQRVVEWLRTQPGNENLVLDDIHIQGLPYDPSETSSDSDDYSDDSDEYPPAKMPRLFAYKTLLGTDETK